MNIVYFRCKRVGSSNMQQFISQLKQDKYINDYFFPGHAPILNAKNKCIKKNGPSWWDGAVKVVSVRNVWKHHVSLFLMNRKMADSFTGSHPRPSLAYFFKDLSLEDQQKYIDDFRELVSLQVEYWEDTAGLTKKPTKDMYDKTFYRSWDKKYGVPISQFNYPLFSQLPYYVSLDKEKNKPTQSYKKENIQADYIIRLDHEFLELDLKRFLKNINVPPKKFLDYTSKRSYVRSESHFDHKDFYDEKTKAGVAKIRSAEIVFHNWKYS